MKKRSWNDILDSLGPKYARKKRESSGPPQPKAWADRKATMELYEPHRLFFRPLPGFFLGVGRLAGNGYSEWRSGEIAAIYPNTAKRTKNLYGNWISSANSFIDTDDGVYASEGYTLLYQLLIEPFTMMDLSSPVQDHSAVREARDIPENLEEDREAQSGQKSRRTV